MQWHLGPSELVLESLRLLGPIDLSRLALTCTHMRRIMDDPRIWVGCIRATHQQCADVIYLPSITPPRGMYVGRLHEFRCGQSTGPYDTTTLWIRMVNHVHAIRPDLNKRVVVAHFEAMQENMLAARAELMINYALFQRCVDLLPREVRGFPDLLWHRAYMCVATSRVDFRSRSSELVASVSTSMMVLHTVLETVVLSPELTDAVCANAFNPTFRRQTLCRLMRRTRFLATNLSRVAALIGTDRPKSCSED